MELKHFHVIDRFTDRFVLIVPYGIETRALTGSWDQRSIVLIVPYGIETTKTNYSFFIKFSVNCTLWN